MNDGARRLAEWRARKKITQRTLANDLDTDSSTVSHWENGRRRPGLEEAVALREKTGIPVEAWMQPLTRAAG